MLYYLLFWASFVLILYIYIGYPLLVFVLSLLINKNVKKTKFNSKVTIVIPAYNEEKCIRETLGNKLALDYPKNDLEIIVVSDGSTDKTDEIVKEFKDKRIRLLRQETRMGKTLALNRAVKEAEGEIIVFSDANSLYSRDALEHLLSNFSDDSVGYVTGKMIYIKDEGSAVGEGCSAYMMYENFLRSSETNIGSVVGVDGGIDAVRKCLCEPMKADQLPDFILPLKVVEKGYRVVYEKDAIIREESLTDFGDEYRMRVRVALRALKAMKEMKHLINPRRTGLFAWQYLSHKVMRYLAFLFFILMYCINIKLISYGNIYIIIFLLQNLFYLGALLGWIIEKRGTKSGILYIPFYFCLINIAAAQAFIMMLRGSKMIIWEPRRG